MKQSILLTFFLLGALSCINLPSSSAHAQDVTFSEFGPSNARDTAGHIYDEPPPMVIDTDLLYYATFQTEQGEMVIRLFADRAPVTVNNFVFLARDGYYDNTTFHRVINNFMAQGGDPTGTGSGGPGYAFEDEIVADLRFDRAGLLAMANSGPNTNGSQFFLTFAATSWLNGNHTIFGEVVDGIDVLDLLTHRDPASATTPGDELFTIVIEEREAAFFQLLLPIVVAD